MDRPKKAKETKRVDYFKYDPVVNKKETFNIDKALNENWDKTADEFERQEEQITVCKGEIGKVKEQIAGIDVTTDVEEVVTRLVNSDRSTPLNTLINNIKETIINHVTGIKDAIVSHITTKSTEINNNTNSVRDNIKSHVTSALNNMQPKQRVYTLSTNVLYQDNAEINASVSTANNLQVKILKKFTCKYDGIIKIMVDISYNMANQSGRAYIDLPNTRLTHTSVVRFDTATLIRSLPVGTLALRTQDHVDLSQSIFPRSTGYTSWEWCVKVGAGDVIMLYSDTTVPNYVISVKNFKILGSESDV